MTSAGLLNGFPHVMDMKCVLSPWRWSETRPHSWVTSESTWEQLECEWLQRLLWAIPPCISADTCTLGCPGNMCSDRIQDVLTESVDCTSLRRISVAACLNIIQIQPRLMEMHAIFAYYVASCMFCRVFILKCPASGVKRSVFWFSLNKLLLFLYLLMHVSKQFGNQMFKTGAIT